MGFLRNKFGNTNDNSISPHIVWSIILFEIIWKFPTKKKNKNLTIPLSPTFDGIPYSLVK